jgi:ankyrin repeat protein
MRTIKQTQTHTRLMAAARVVFRRRITPLHEAAYYGHVAVVVSLLTHGADVRAKDNDGCGSRSLF